MRQSHRKRFQKNFNLKQLHNLTDMEEELFRIEEYVGMALQYQRLNSTANDYILKRISLDAVIREVIHKYAKIMIRRKIRMHYEKTEAAVISDEKWLAFVLEQLLSNAVKYTPEGEITIKVWEEPQQIWLEIRDTGIGIRSEDIPRVFEKGYTGFNGHETSVPQGSVCICVGKHYKNWGIPFRYSPNGCWNCRSRLDFQRYHRFSGLMGVFSAEIKAVYP